MGKIYKFNDDEIKDMIEMYTVDFVPIYKISKKYEVDADVITKRLKDNGIIIAKGSAYSKKYWFDRGMNENEIDGHIKTLRPVNKEFWVKNGYSEEDAVLQIEGQKLVSLRGCIARFGEKDGNKIWNERAVKRSEDGKLGSANIQYWINKGYSEEEAKIKRSERQSTFSREICINKYGEIEGLKRFTERQNKWSNSLSKGGNLKMGYSKISQELFYKLLEAYEIEDRNNIYFATHNKEFKLNKCDSEGGIWAYDFTDMKNKRIIEFHGDTFHGNPNKYKFDDYPHPFKRGIMAQEIWNKDKRKYDIAIKEGFEMLIIWDSEYRWGNKEKVINKCIKFLKSNDKRNRNR